MREHRAEENLVPVLEAKGIYKEFQEDSPTNVAKRILLQDIRLNVFQGESIAILGKSGEGKTTLLHILGALEKPTKGDLFFQGQLVTPKLAPTLYGRKIGYLFQAFHLLDELTVLENILVPARIWRLDNKEHLKRAHQLLEEVGLHTKPHQITKRLSGGEKQRLALARALLLDPLLLLLDEPTGNLDHETAQSVQELILSFSKKRGKSLILVTHDKIFANNCDIVYSIDNSIFKIIT